MIAKIAAVLLVVLVGWAYKAIQPPPPRTCGSPNGPPVTSPRIKLRDGRHLAYKESGTPKEKANYKIITIHGLDSSKEFILPASNVYVPAVQLQNTVDANIPVHQADFSLAFQELVDELAIYFLSFDRAGYGESDPNPKRSVKSEAMDIEELADQLDIGSKFYVIGLSMGGYAAWGCLNYIPHRLAGVALVVPVINYWWPSFPASLSRQVYRKMLVQDQRAIWIAHHVPFLLYGWMTQKWFPALACIERNPEIFSDQDMELIQKLAENPKFSEFMLEDKARQQGIFESLHRDIMVLYSNWEFDPMNMSNPFPQNEGSVHVWQGSEDRLVSVELQRYVSQKLPWIKYHENPEGGHMFIFIDGWSESILKALLLGQNQDQQRHCFL